MPRVIEELIKDQSLNHDEVAYAHGFILAHDSGKTGKRLLESVPVLPYSAENVTRAHLGQYAKFFRMQDHLGGQVDGFHVSHIQRLFAIGLAQWEFKRPNPSEARLIIPRRWANRIKQWAEKQKSS